MLGNPELCIISVNDFSKSGTTELGTSHSTIFSKSFFSSIDSSIFGTSKFYKEQSKEKKDNIYEDIDRVIKDTSKNEE